MLRAPHLQPPSFGLKLATARPVSGARARASCVQCTRHPACFRHRVDPVSPVNRPSQVREASQSQPEHHGGDRRNPAFDGGRVVHWAHEDDSAAGTADTRVDAGDPGAGVRSDRTQRPRDGHQLAPARSRVASEEEEEEEEEEGEKGEEERAETVDWLQCDRCTALSFDTHSGR
jgi:hypothetical protein